MIRVGIGYDSHRFGAGRPLILGGVTIPYSLGLVGHSDADAVSHALTDALLGAAALGDIGRLFPDTDPAYANAYFVNANATSAPGIVDADRNPILTRSEVYSGVYGRASISFYAFNSSGNKGIACGLNNLQKIRDGEPLGGKASAESDFASDEDDDFLN